jgi:hypothetical protein
MFQSESTINSDTCFMVWMASIWEVFLVEQQSSRVLCYDRRIVGIKHPSGDYDHIFVTVRQLRVGWCGALSLTGGRVCRLQLLLALSSAVILGSESRGTRDHILLSQIEDFPFCRLLRLAGPRWSYSTPHPRGMEQQICRCTLYTYVLGLFEEFSRSTVFVGSWRTCNLDWYLCLEKWTHWIPSGIGWVALVEVSYQHQCSNLRPTL